MKIAKEAGMALKKKTCLFKKMSYLIGISCFKHKPNLGLKQEKKNSLNVFVENKSCIILHSFASLVNTTCFRYFCMKRTKSRK